MLKTKEMELALEVAKAIKAGMGDALRSDPVSFMVEGNIAATVGSFLIRSALGTASPEAHDEASELLRERCRAARNYSEAMIRVLDFFDEGEKADTSEIGPIIANFVLSRVNL